MVAVVVTQSPSGTREMATCDCRKQTSTQLPVMVTDETKRRSAAFLKK